MLYVQGLRLVLVRRYASTGEFENFDPHAVSAHGVV